MRADNELTWLFSPGAQSFLGSMASMGPEHWQLQGLRRLPHRSSYRTQSESRPFFLKVYEPDSLWQRWKIAYQAKTEWELLHRLRAHGLSVPRPLALAQRKSDGLYWIFQEWIDAKPWDHPASQQGRNLSSLRRLGSLLRSLHACGLRDPDRHAGNFLLDGEGGSWAIDFQKARLGPPLHFEERRRALALLDAALISSLTPRERARILREYLGQSDKNFREEALAIASASLEIRGKHLRRKSARAVRENRRFEAFAAEGLHGFLRRGEDCESLAELCRNWRNGQLVSLKGGRRTQVSTSTGPSPRIVKAYLSRGLLAGLRKELGLGRARRAWMRAFHLELAKVPIAKPIALLEGPHADLLICEKIEGGETLSHVLARHTTQSDTLLSIARSLAELIARIHQGGLRARDLRGENLLVRLEGADWVVRLVDFDGLRPCRNRSRQIADLGRLGASFDKLPPRVVLHFLRSYLRASVGIASPQSVRRLAGEAAMARIQVQERWRRQGKIS